MALVQIPPATTIAGYVELASGTMSGSSVPLSSIVGTYRNLVLVIRDAFVSAPGNELSLRINGDSSSNYRYSVMRGGITTLSNGTGQSLFRCAGGTTNLPTSATAVSYIIQLNEYANATYHPISVLWNHNGGDNGFTIGQQDTITAAITSLTILPHAGATFSGGTYRLYGVT